MTDSIHPSAYVESSAQIGKNVTVEPFAVVKGGVTLQDNVTIKSHAYIDGNTTIGEGTVIFPSVSIGTKPQHMQYHGENTQVIIGKDCEIREFATINASVGEGTAVTVGDGCLIMAYSHIAHNCKVGNKVVMANSATLAGHVEVEDNAIIGGLTPIHQYVRIGCYAMVGGMSRVAQDVPPYTLGAGSPYKFGGLNLVGLKRHGFSLQTRKCLGKAFRITFRSGLHLDEALKRIEEEVELLPEIQHWIDFCKATNRGLEGLHGVTRRSQKDAAASEERAEQRKPALTASSAQ